jgi:hypothetical protein
MSSPEERFVADAWTAHDETPRERLRAGYVKADPFALDAADRAMIAAKKAAHASRAHAMLTRAMHEPKPLAILGPGGTYVTEVLE